VSAPALVLDVVPPPDLPPVRPPSRLASGLLVALVLALVTSLSLIMAPPANAWVVPVAKAVGAVGLSLVVEEGFDIATKDGEEKPADDDESEDAKKKRGKWGSRLKGMLDIGSGVLGALFGIDTAFDDEGEGDGVEMPEGFADDVEKVGQGSDGTNKPGGYRNWTVKQSTVRFDGIANAGVQKGPGVTAEAECGGGSINATSFPCDQVTGSVEIAGGSRARCFNRSTGEFYNRSMTVRLNSSTPVNPACWRSTGGTSGTNDPIQSVLFISNPAGIAIDGYPDAVRVVNPNFDDTVVPEGLKESVTAETQCTNDAGESQTVTKTVQGTTVMPLAPCPAGYVPTRTDWVGKNNGASEWLGGLETKTPAAYPNCPPGKCTRVIMVDNQPCDAYRPECYDWMNTEPPARVRCEFGPYTMPIAECEDLEHTHKTPWGVAPEIGPDGKPEWVPARPDGTIDVTRIDTDPGNDEPFPDNPKYRPPTRDTVVSAPPQNSTTPVPTPTPTPQPDPPGQPGSGDPVPNPPGGPPDYENPTQSCMGQMASWNPLDWVFTPVKCALTWAFVPKNGAGRDAMIRFRQNFTDSGIGPWLAVPPLLFDDLPEGSGCQGPPLTMPASLGGKTYYPLNACSDPMAKYANMSRSLITVVVVFYGMFSVVNSLTTSLTGYRMFERESVDVGKKL